VGGVPRGRIIEIFGPESSGKTTLALHVIAEAQKKGGIAAFIDAEHALDPTYARALGVNTEDLLVSQPDTGEQALEITETLVRSGALDVIVIDSVAALVPAPRSKARWGFADGTPGAAHVAGHAQTDRRDQQIPHVGRLHQPDPHEDRRDVRQSRNDHGRKRAEILRLRPDGHPPDRRHQGRHRRDRKSDQGQGGQEQSRFAVQGSGIRHLVRTGISKSRGDRHGTELGVLEKSGTWYSFEQNRIGQGRENVRRFLMKAENRDLNEKIEAAVKAKLGLVKLKSAEEGKDAETE